LLDQHAIPYRYREYRKEPLDEGELRSLFARLGQPPAALLRRQDRAFEELGLSGEEGDEDLIALMAKHPTLLQRPIGVLGEKAIVGRPPERLLELKA
jgi:arsenate reductase (glutaredoxin)